MSLRVALGLSLRLQALIDNAKEGDQVRKVLLDSDAQALADALRLELLLEEPEDDTDVDPVEEVEGRRDTDREPAAVAVLVKLTVSHSTSRRHDTYPCDCPAIGLHRPPCCAHQWQSSAPPQMSERQISVPHCAAHRYFPASPCPTQYCSPPHHWHDGRIDATWQMFGSSGAIVVHTVWHARVLGVQ